jgi:hypothetical protein
MSHAHDRPICLCRGPLGDALLQVDDGFAVADQDGFPRPEITPVFMPTPGATNCGADCSSTWMRLVSRRARPGSLGKKAAAFLNRFGDVPCILLVGAQALAQVALNLS